ncbi:MAG: hypothetical protein OK474_10485 [Thaumarchaeota archaeon]|nr:hypothetical protein [Nitrososphaerota archaeon]
MIYVIGVLFILFNAIFPLSNVLVISISQYEIDRTPVAWLQTVPPSAFGEIDVLPNVTLQMAIKINATTQFVDNAQLVLSINACRGPGTIQYLYVGFNGAYFWPPAAEGFQVGGTSAGLDKSPIHGTLYK